MKRTLLISLLLSSASLHVAGQTAKESNRTRKIEQEVRRKYKNMLFVILDV